MLVPFKSLPKDSRIWIFPSSEEIDIQKKVKIKERLIKFVSDWTSHNKNLQASFELPYNRFIVVALNENLQNASGCSIDALMNLIQILEKEFDLILLDRMNVLYRDKSKKINYFNLLKLYSCISTTYQFPPPLIMTDRIKMPTNKP